jgi:hypothetical protein
MCQRSVFSVLGVSLLLTLGANRVAAEVEPPLRIPTAKIIASDASTLLPSIIEIDGVRSESVISNGKIAGFRAGGEIILVTYTRVPGGGGAVSHLVLQNHKGQPIALTQVPAPLSIDPAYSQYFVEDTRSLEAIELELAMLREQQKKDLRAELNRELARRGEGSRSEPAPNSSQR